MPTRPEIRDAPSEFGFERLEATIEKGFRDLTIVCALLTVWYFTMVIALVLLL